MMEIVLAIKGRSGHPLENDPTDLLILTLTRYLSYEVCLRLGQKHIKTNRLKYTELLKTCR